jgi:hypothetical protein
MKTNLFALIFLGVCCLPSVSAQTAKKTGDFEGDSQRKRASITAERSLNYRPRGDAFVSVNGKNRFTRALYGSSTAFRIETSDRPVFAAFYSSTNNRHIAFKIRTARQELALDSLDFCRSESRPGRRDYELRDKRLGKGLWKVSVLAFGREEGAIWKFEIPPTTSLVGELTEARQARLNRNGDMGADPADAFERPLQPKQLKRFETTAGKLLFVVLEKGELFPVETAVGQKRFDEAESDRLNVANTLRITTPDPFLNTLGGTLSSAADGIWDGKVWLHGAIGWRMPLPGWRAAYTGDALGWHDRARTHFDHYAASQVTDVEPILPQPQQDSALNLARALKQWGTPMYSNGYICRNPDNNKQMHHYDMNLAYTDELLWHLLWTGDLAYARKIFPTLQRSLAWEKRNWDPDNDGLYEAYAATWASDALMYNSGGTTLGSAYNYRANRLAAEIAALIGEDPTLYEKEAATILKAVNQRLWLPDKGWWAEFVDFMGNKQVHPDAAVWSIYTALDSDLPDKFQAYQATRYLDEHIPHIPIRCKEFKGSFETVATSNWMPYNWSLNNVAFAEVGHTALAYWQAGRPDEAYNLFKSAVLDGMFLGRSPGNVGQISYYDAALGETYRDFGDVIGVYSRDVVQGLFGILPDLLHDKLLLKPGFPRTWHSASIQHRDLDFAFERNRNRDEYRFTSRFPKPVRLELEVTALRTGIRSVTVNGKPVVWEAVEAVNAPVIQIPCGQAAAYRIEIEWMGPELAKATSQLLETYNPQRIEPGSPGTYFEKRQVGRMTWWKAVDRAYPAPVVQTVDWRTGKQPDFRTVRMDQALNAAVTDIFTNRYLTPRSPYTTMQTPTQGVGEWCQPLLTYRINDQGFREAVKEEVFKTPEGLPFRIPTGKNNIAFTTLWDNYPDSISVPLNGKARTAFLLMAGTTQPMQYGVCNGKITVRYTDGSTSELVLQNPDNWCPIEQDYYQNDFSLRLNAPRPYRVGFKTGLVSRELGKALGIPSDEVSRRDIDGGAGLILEMPLQPDKELQSIQWKAVANEVIVGMMAVTLLNP